MNSKRSDKDLKDLFAKARKSCRDDDLESMKQILDSLEKNFSQQTKKLEKLNLKLKCEASERKFAESLYKKSSEKYRAIFNSTYDGLAIFLIDQDDIEKDIYVEINQSFTEMTGYTLEELQKVTTHELIKSPADFDAIRTRAFSGHGVLFDAEFIRKDKSILNCEISSRTFSIGENKFLVSIIRDTSLRHEAEIKLQKQADELRSSQRTAHIGSWFRDHIADTVVWSEESYRIFGFKNNNKPMPLKKFFDIVHSDDVERIKRASEPDGDSMHFSVYYRIYRVNDGVERWIYSHGEFTRDKNGKIVKTKGINQDITDIREAKEELRQSEDNFRRLIGKICDGLWDWNINTEDIVLDEKACDTLGLRHDQNKISTKILESIIHPADTEVFFNAIKSVMQSEQGILNVSHRIKAPGGKYVWLLNRAVLRRDAFGRPARLLGYFENLDQSLRYDEIKENLEFRQKLLDSIPIPVYYKDINGVYLGQNSAMMKLLPPEETSMAGKKTKDMDPHLLNKDRSARIIRAEKKLLEEGGDIITQEIDVYDHSRNKTLNMLIHKELLRDSKGTPQYFVGVLMDITDQKTTEKKLKETSMMLNTTLNSMREMLLIFDSEMKLSWANNVSRAVFGKLPRKRTWGSIWKNARTMNGRKLRPPKGVIRNGKAQIEIICKLKGGKILEIRRYPVRNISGKISGLFEVVLDVTDREKEKAQAALRQEKLIENDKLRSLGTLVAGVAHEINNPNNFMSINSSVLDKIWKTIKPVVAEAVADGKKLDVGMIRSADLNNTVSELLGGIKEGSKRIRAIVESLKAYSRQQPAGNITLFNFNDALKNAMFLMSNMLRKSSENISCKYAKNLPKVKANQQRVEQVIVNILQNACQAIEYNHQGIEICSGLAKDKSEVFIEVCDHGSGIAPGDLSHITDPFFTTRRNSGGTGLGLSISSSILKEHSGRLEINSKKGRGCTVRIILPAVTVSKEGEKNNE